MARRRRRIYIKPANRGKLRKQTGTKKGKKIPVEYPETAEENLRAPRPARGPISL